MTIKCAYCNKRFEAENSRYQHTKKKHPNRKNPKPTCDDDEPSMADLVIEARLAAACGDPVEGWLGDMFHDEIYGELK